MSETAKHEITALLNKIEQGSKSSQEGIIEILYRELHNIAQNLIKKENVDFTYQATELVNEAYIRLFDDEKLNWQDRNISMVKYTVKAIAAVKKDKSIKAINVKRDIQNKYVKKMQASLKKTVWQNDECTAFYRKNMTGIVTSLSPKSMTYLIFTRKRFNLNDYNLLT